MKVLVFNSGSSSIKYQVFDMRDRSVIARGALERIGEAGSCLRHQSERLGEPLVDERPATDHGEAMRRIRQVLHQTQTCREPDELFGIGHRMAHGGEWFREPTLIDLDVLEAMRGLNPLAPLHNPAMVMGIEFAMDRFPGVPQVAVFDTAFHHTLPPHAFQYAIPRDLSERFHVRRYGFHGTSVQYVIRQAAAWLGRPLQSLNLIVLHLGNGCSATAVRQGRSVDTSMGMTPLAGLVMGSRCGDVDPGVLVHLLRVTGWTCDQLEDALNKNSGLKGLCGDNDMRRVLERAGAGDRQAQQALDMFVYSVKKCVGAYGAVLGDLDALVFTGGIGERSAPVRARVCEGLDNLGITLDTDRNRGCGLAGGAVHGGRSRVAVLVVPTDEQLEIAEQTVATIQARQKDRL